MISVYFTGPRQAALLEEADPRPGFGQVLVQTVCSAISPGSELLVYRGQFPRDLAVDDGIPALSGAFQYPLRYGYAAVGRVIGTGEGVGLEWKDRLVFSFQPHASHFAARVEAVHLLPKGISEEQAVFLPNMETAVNFVQDGAPLIGERAAVFGQGIVGLLTTAVLRQFPLSGLVTVDSYPLRRQAALELGVDACLDPRAAGALDEIRERLGGGADLTYELSGAPEALNQAIAVTGFAGRVVIGSWYGEKRADLALGGYFHRSRIRLISSQVTTLAPELSGRWDKARRFELAWAMIERLQPQKWITHRFPLHEAAQAYELLDRNPQETLQVIMTY